MTLLIEHDRIASVGQLDDVSDAEVVGARHWIVLPDLVDSHRHMSQSALRTIAYDWTLGQYNARMQGHLGGVRAPWSAWSTRSSRASPRSHDYLLGAAGVAHPGLVSRAAGLKTSPAGCVQNHK